MPVYNEASTVEDVIRKVLEQPQVAELIVVDDASTDGTWDVLQKLSAENTPPATNDSLLKTFRHNNNQGKGAALRAALNSHPSSLNSSAARFRLDRVAKWHRSARTILPIARKILGGG